MRVSVIIPTLNSAIIDQTLDSLLEQTCAVQIAEILVVGLDEPGLVRERGPVRFISTGEPVWAPVSRNIGIEQAVGDMLAFVDSDCVALPTWLEELLACVDRGMSVVSGGVSLRADDYRRLAYNLALFSGMLATSRAGRRQSVPSLNLLMSREVIDAVGLFNEDLPRSHDVELSCRIRRAGYQIHFWPAAQVRHLPEVRDWRAAWARLYRSGFYSTEVRRSHRDMIDTLWLFEYPLLYLAMSPVLSAALTVLTFTKNRGMARYLYAAPAVFALKMAWCLGSSRQVRAGRAP